MSISARRNYLRRTLLGVVLLGALLVAVRFVVTTATVRQSHDPGVPSEDIIKPLPGSFSVAAAEVFPPSSQATRSTRVVAIKASGDSSNPVKTLSESLASGGWRRTAANAGLSPDGSVCMAIDRVSDYIADNSQPARIRSWLQQDGGPQSSAQIVVTLFHC
jgi:hypothetical protein